ncbi:diaminohydroxyphosphoribosylaminopyrimidine deaminase [Bacterioplanes sanyensis]|uniref:Diaminohydroxyphosphoribosylaminopyrimidine deaminase n=1 Tax=Bacterioplanes sanyensis TaxID=1249553 RepID=A0A222FI37_9GAMM|nr:bifunctional diaminohydroxyphosphoribosylaminopyrimidine deaminase/5-amino-6-(5-phosphoribosylamino)uracil reductase RibD [Bacterioplanes sanyensis]ASP38430.1 diaminohydroxyphosphoribosylaminopyrimidine deaminase [Bacterioplanes sanyensis]
MDDVFMQQALAVSRQALPACQPNPPVGCVLVKDGKIVAQGHTQAIGGNHAEVQAMQQYRGSLSEVTAYVTLEPCSFAGRTPSCAQMLARSGIQRIVVALLDPDPRNNGRGINILKDAGISVDVGCAADQVAAFLHPHLGHS